jgi:serine/threonine protein kinase
MKFGEYNVIDKIGKGGFGEVFIVEKDSKKYAIKICSEEDEEHLKRFSREIRLSGSVTHDNVIDILDSDYKHIPPYFVMPLCQGFLSEKNYDKNVELLLMIYYKFVMD